ncbi:MAG TPA: SRPBCC domain-containing protein [Cytophagaceae bacterium]|jgi:hypothetical protein
MATNNFTINLFSEQTPEQVFQTINNVGGWWSGYYGEQIKGNTQNLNDEFSFTAGEGAHFSQHKLIEVIPNQKIVWLTTDSYLNFIEKGNEWTGTKVIFEIAAKENNIQLTFTHEGLTPDIECYEACSTAWTSYLNNKLSPLINEGRKE